MSRGSLKVTGRLVSVDSATGTLRLKAQGKELEMTAVTKTAKKALGKLKAGDRISVSYTEREGKTLALPAGVAQVKLRTKKIGENGWVAAERK